MKVLVAIDEDEFMMPIIDAVARLFGGPGTTVKLLNVIDTSTLLNDVQDQSGPGKTRRLLETRLKAAAFMLKQARINLLCEADSLEVEESVLVGTAHRVILDCAEEWNADVVVIGAHSHGDNTRLRVSSVSTAVLRLADRPVTVVSLPKSVESKGSTLVQQQTSLPSFAT